MKFCLSVFISFHKIIKYFPKICRNTHTHEWYTRIWSTRIHYTNSNSSCFSMCIKCANVLHAQNPHRLYERKYFMHIYLQHYIATQQYFIHFENNSELMWLVNSTEMHKWVNSEQNSDLIFLLPLLHDCILWYLICVPRVYNQKFQILQLWCVVNSF